MGSPANNRAYSGKRDDIVRPFGIGFVVLALTPLVMLPMASIFY
jgi:hypothetical protein